VSAACLLCRTPIGEFERVAPGSWWDVDGTLREVHVECALRSVVGGIGHLIDHGAYCVAMGDPDAGNSYRASALLVAAWVDEHGLPDA